MLRSDVVVSHPSCFINRKLENTLGSGRKFRLRNAGTRCRAGQPLDHILDAPQIQPKFAQHPPSYSAFFADQTEEQMLGSDIVVLELLGFFLR
jgi:hypothetical protein